MLYDVAEEIVLARLRGYYHIQRRIIGIQPPRRQTVVGLQLFLGHEQIIQTRAVVVDAETGFRATVQSLQTLQPLIVAGSAAKGIRHLLVILQRPVEVVLRHTLVGKTQGGCHIVGYGTQRHQRRTQRHKHRDKHRPQPRPSKPLPEYASTQVCHLIMVAKGVKNSGRVCQNEYG